MKTNIVYKKNDLVIRLEADGYVVTAKGKFIPYSDPVSYLPDAICILNEIESAGAK